MASEDKQVEKASISIFTITKTINWLSRARCLAWFRSAFADQVTKELENEGSRKTSQDIESIHQPKAKTFYTLSPRKEIMTLERQLKKNFSVEEESDGLNTNEYYKQYRQANK